MITIDGKYTEARVFTDELEDLARTQIRDVCNHPAFEGSRVRIMPDVHAGAGCVIGFTAELKTDKVIPNLIGVLALSGVVSSLSREYDRQRRLRGPQANAGHRGK